MRDLGQDLRLAVRSLRARPSFTLAVVATLALGLGATTAVTSVVYTVVLAPPPYPEPDAIVQIARVSEGRRIQMLPPADVRDLREEVSALLTLGVSRFQDVALSESGSPERVRAAVVTGSTLAMLGVPPVLGRLPGATEDLPGGPCVVALSHRIWTDHFGAEPDVVGQITRLDGDPCAVVAVMPPGFAFPAPYFAPGDLWLLAGPAHVDWSAEAGPGFLVFGRLQPGVDPSAARAGLDVISARRGGEDRLTAMPWAAPSRDASRQRLLTLLAAAALVLVIACVNVATLQLARNVDRRAEIATRMALGASTGRLARLLVAETVVLTVAGAAAGLLAARWSVDLIVALRSFFIPRMEEVAINGVAVAVCLGLAFVAGLVATVIPAFGLSDVGASSTMRGSARGLTGGARGRRFGRVLVMVETGLALVLIAGAAILLQSYRGLTTLDPGFRTADILSARVTPPASRYSDDQALAAFYREIEERVASLPGIVDLGLTNVPPGVGAGAQQAFALVGVDPPLPRGWHQTVWRAVGDGYFRTLGIPLVRGEGLERYRGSPHVAVVNEAFARRFFADGDGLGERLHLVATPNAEVPEEEAWTIVGVVADAHEEYAYTPPPPAVYVRYEDAPPRSMALLARTTGAPLTMAGPLRDAIASVDPEQPLWGIRDLEFMLASEYDLNRLSLTLLALFAGAALLLAIAGIYGVVAHIVGQRLREMGIRIALGALRADVLRLILGDCARFAVAGALAGLALVALTADRLRTLTPVWPGVDPRVLAGAALVVTAVAIIAAWVPARRAAAADPVEALRRQ